MHEPAKTAVQLHACQECLRIWLEPRERWRAYLTDETPSRPILYCPVCAGREFDPDPE